VSGDFYIGYQKKVPAGIAAFVRQTVMGVVVLSVAIGALLVTAQRPFDRSVFEFGTTRTFEGVINDSPYPTLLVTRPGTTESGENVSRFSLVAPGKHGAKDAIADHVRKRVRLEGTLVYRDSQTMIEIVDESIHVLADGDVSSVQPRSLGEFTLVGEIVDSKCYLGVMKPGNLKPHRACAVRCISGGIPPVFLVRGQDGSAQYLMLIGADGETVNDEVLDMVAENIEITGVVEYQDGQLSLRADPGTYRRLTGTMR